jgi:hypothetical protein
MSALFILDGGGISEQSAQAVENRPDHREIRVDRRFQPTPAATGSARRITRMAVEDIGLADPQGLITKTIMMQRKAFPAASIPGGNAPQTIP